MYLYYFWPWFSGAFPGIFSRGIVRDSRLPRMRNPVSRIPWSREKGEIPLPHKRVRRKLSKARSRTNKPRDNVEIPHSVNRRTRNPGDCQAGPPAQKDRLM